MEKKHLRYLDNLGLVFCISCLGTHVGGKIGQFFIILHPHFRPWPPGAPPVPPTSAQSDHGQELECHPAGEILTT